MVPSAHEKVVGVAHFPRQHGHDDFHREAASVDEVSVEEVGVGF